MNGPRVVGPAVEVGGGNTPPLIAIHDYSGWVGIDARVITHCPELASTSLKIRYFPPMNTLSCGLPLPVSEVKPSRSGLRCGMPGGSALSG